MQRSLTVLTALAAALVLSSCSSSGDGQASAPTPTPAETVTVTAAPTRSAPAAATTMEGVYLEQLRKTHAGLQTAPDDGLIGIGEGVCTMYGNGGSTDEVNNFLATGAGVSYTLQELAAMHGAAVAAFCPEHMDSLTGGGL